MRHRQGHISDIYPNILKFEVNMGSSEVLERVSDPRIPEQGRRLRNFSDVLKRVVFKNGLQRVTAGTLPLVLTSQRPTWSVQVSSAAANHLQSLPERQVGYLYSKGPRSPNSAPSVASNDVFHLSTVLYCYFCVCFKMIVVILNYP